MPLFAGGSASSEELRDQRGNWELVFLGLEPGGGGVCPHTGMKLRTLQLELEAEKFCL